MGRLLALIAILMVTMVDIAHSQTVDEDQIDAVLRGSPTYCPPGGRIDPVSICQRVLEACAAHVTMECDQEGNACLQRQRELNKKISDYNEIVEKCGNRARAGASPTQQNQSAMSRALEDAKKKALGASEQNERAREQVKQQQQDVQERQAEVERRAAAEADRRAQQDVIAAQERARQLEQQRNQRELADAQKFRCYSHSDQCENACLVYFNVQQPNRYEYDQCWKHCRTPSAIQRYCWKIP